MCFFISNAKGFVLAKRYFVPVSILWAFAPLFPCPTVCEAACPAVNF